MTSYGLSHFKQMVWVWKTKSLLVFRRQNHVTFIFTKTMSHGLLVQVAYYVCFIELLFTDQWHAIPVRGLGSLPFPPPLVRAKKEKNAEGRKAGRASKTKPPLPPSSRSESATEYTYKHYFLMASNSSSVIKQLLNLNWLSQNVVFAQIIYYLHDELSMLLLPCGEGGKDVLSWGQALTFQHYSIYQF